MLTWSGKRAPLVSCTGSEDRGEQGISPGQCSGDAEPQPLHVSRHKPTLLRVVTPASPGKAGHHAAQDEEQGGPEPPAGARTLSPGMAQAGPLLCQGTGLAAGVGKARRMACSSPLVSPTLHQPLLPTELVGR